MKPMKKVLVALSFSPDLIPGLDDHMAMMADHGFDVTLCPEQRRLTEDEVVKRLRGVPAFVASTERMTGRVIAACPDLKVIPRMGVGYDSVDLHAATRQKVAVTVTPSANAEAVTEYIPPRHGCRCTQDRCGALS